MSLKSTFSNSTSKSYALALYQLAKENSELEKVENEMNGLKKLLIESSDFKEMILNPTIQKEEKKRPRKEREKEKQGGNAMHDRSDWRLGVSGTKGKEVRKQTPSSGGARTAIVPSQLPGEPGSHI